MLAAYIFLKERYKKLQYAGATIIVGGILLVLIPNLLNSDAGDSDIVLFNIIFLVSNVPTALSNVYKEFAFTEEMDVNLLQAWVANWQLVFGLLLCPLNSLKFLGDNYLPLKELPRAIIDGGKCMVGINSIVSNCWDPHSGTPHPTGVPQCDDCDGAWVMLFLYLCFNLAYNVTILLVVKYGGANLMNFVLTLRLPLIQIVFSLKFINNPPSKFTWNILVGLFIILGGLILYRISSRRVPEGKEEGAMLLIGGQEPIPIFIQRHIDTRTDPQRIRSGFYARLGITSSPQRHTFRQYKGPETHEKLSQ